MATGMQAMSMSNGMNSRRPSHANIEGELSPTGPVNQPYSSSKVWGNNIWSNVGLGSGLGSTARNASRKREPPYLGASTDDIEGKTGSSSLLGESEKDDWGPSPWGTDTRSRPVTHSRAQDVSPNRHGQSAQHIGPSYAEQSQHPSSRYSASRSGSISAGPGAKNTLDPSAGTFLASQEAFHNGFASFGRMNDLDSRAPFDTQWPQHPTLRSPVDERRNVPGADYFPNSNAPSRSGSLPPSRHGDATPSQEVATRFSQLQGTITARGHGPSLSTQTNGRSYLDHGIPQQTEGLSTVPRLSADANMEYPTFMHRHSVGSSGQAQPSNESPFSRQYQESTRNALSRDDNAFFGSGSFTPDSHNARHNFSNQPEPPSRFRNPFQLPTPGLSNQSAAMGRGALTPNGTISHPGPFPQQNQGFGHLPSQNQSHSHSPYFSTAPTPPTYDRLNPYSSEPQQSRTMSIGNTEELEQRLRGIQLEQYIQQTQQSNHQNMPQMSAAFQQRQASNPYGAFQHSMNGSMPNGTTGMNALPQNLLPFSASPANGVNAQATSTQMGMMGLPMQIQMQGFAQGMPGFNTMGAMGNVNIPIGGQDPPKGPRGESKDPSDAVVSTLLAEFRKTGGKNSAGKKWELKDIWDHIVEFSGDQHGSRLIQQKLETANSEEKDHVFREVKTNALQLMQDVFGNYVIQKFFEHGDQNQKKFLANKMKGQVVQLSFQMYGCRVVQKALESVLSDQQAALIAELRGEPVIRLIFDQNGNHVIQKAIERVHYEHINFIGEALERRAVELAMHPYGCRVVQRWLEFVPDHAKAEVLMQLDAGVPTLVDLQYGNYVAQAILEHGQRSNKDRIIDTILPRIGEYSRQKFASNVVEKCMVHGTLQQQRELMLAFVDSSRQCGGLLSYIKDSYANYVIQRFLDCINPTDFAAFVSYLQPEFAKAKRQMNGKQITSLEKKMRRFVHDPSKPASPNGSITSNSTSIPSGPAAQQPHYRPRSHHERHGASPPAIDTRAEAPAADNDADLDPSTTPPLTNDAQSPQSSSLPSTNASTVGEVAVSRNGAAYDKPPNVADTRDVRVESANP